MLIILGITVVFFFFNQIPYWPLRNWDEAWYGEIIKNMAVKDYGWLMPYWNGRYYFDHPPLYFWLSGLVVRLFGLGEWQLRLMSAIAGVGVVGLTYLLGKKLFNPRVGIIAVLVVMSLGQVVIRFSHGNLDALLTLTFLTTFYLFLVSGKKLVAAVGAGVTMGLGFLVKGWLVGLLPLAVIAWQTLVAKTSFLKVGLIALVSGSVFMAWIIPGAISFGRPFIDRYLLNPDAYRLTEGATWSLKNWVYLGRDVGLWWIVIIGGIATITKLKWEDGRRLIPLTATTIMFIAGLNFLNEKSDWYNLPVYPLVALIIGYVADRLTRIFPRAAWMALGVIVVGQYVNVNRIENIYPDRSKVGAELGEYARNVVPQNETVILDDRDFTAFLYYSDHKMVYVTSRLGNKPDEWWFIKEDELTDFINQHKPVWLVTPVEKGQLANGGEIVTQFKNYNFIRFEK